MARGRAAGVIPYTLESRLVVAGLQMGWKPNYINTNPFSLEKLILPTPLQITTTTNQSKPNILAHDVINY